MRRAGALRVALRLLLLLLALGMRMGVRVRVRVRVVLGAGRLRRGELEVVLRRRGCVVGRLWVVGRVSTSAARSSAAAAGGLVR